MAFIRDRIILDPGFGFGKTFEDNWEIYQNLETIAEIEYTITHRHVEEKYVKKNSGR